MSTYQPSARFVRAAETERQRLMARREKLDRQRTKLKHDIAEVEQHLDVIEGRKSDLDQLLAATTTPAVEDVASLGARLLEGSEIRLTAISLFLKDHPTGGEFNYRELYELVTGCGYLIAGKLPLATFLSNIRRSPLVEGARGKTPGCYRVNLAREALVRSQLTEAIAELQDQLAVDETRFTPAFRAERREVELRIKRHESELLEIEATLKMLSNSPPA